MGTTELRSYKVGDEQIGKHGGGELRVAFEGDDWRVAGGFSVEASSEEEVEEKAEEIIEALSEVGDVDDLE